MRTQTVFLTNSYFVPDRDYRGMLCAAASRGVDTRVLTVGAAATDIKSTLYAGRAHYEELLEAGVRIYEYRETMMHAKTFVVDGRWGAVGSMNADNRSMSFKRHFTEDIQHADEIHLEEFRKRPLLDRVKESGAHLVRRVL